jgi:hypothetical protein
MRKLAQLEGEKKKIAKTCTPISSFFSGNEQHSRYKGTYNFKL